MEKMIKKFNSVQFLLLLFMVFPILTYAVTTPTNFRGLVMIVVDLITAILPIIVLLAFIYFLWGLVKYLKDAGGNKDEATQMMLNGVIGFFVMASVWGFVNILVATLGTTSKAPDLGGAQPYWSGDGVKDSLIEFKIPDK